MPVHGTNDGQILRQRTGDYISWIVQDEKQLRHYNPDENFPMKLGVQSNNYLSCGEYGDRGYRMPLSLQGSVGLLL